MKLWIWKLFTPLGSYQDILRHPRVKPDPFEGLINSPFTPDERKLRAVSCSPTTIQQATELGLELR